MMGEDVDSETGRELLVQETQRLQDLLSRAVSQVSPLSVPPVPRRFCASQLIPLPVDPAPTAAPSIPPELKGAAPSQFLTLFPPPAPLLPSSRLYRLPTFPPCSPWVNFLTEEAPIFNSTNSVTRQVTVPDGISINRGSLIVLHMHLIDCLLSAKGLPGPFPDHRHQSRPRPSFKEGLPRTPQVVLSQAQGLLTAARARQVGGAGDYESCVALALFRRLRSLQVHCSPAFPSLLLLRPPERDQGIR